MGREAYSLSISQKWVVKPIPSPFHKNGLQSFFPHHFEEIGREAYSLTISQKWVAKLFPSPFHKNGS